MTFEEFFKKKRIDLPAMEKANPGLFVEFKGHYELMGERSFDHTKKYWFNKLRHTYQLAPEIKTEKPNMANPLAEQTVTESLTETVEATPAPKPGFTPRFKAANLPKPIIEQPATLPAGGNSAAPISDSPAESAESEAAKPAPKLGFAPKFRAANPPKPAEPDKKADEMPADLNKETPPRPAYKPKFNMKNIPPKKDE